MKILLDTHVLVWLATERHQLSRWEQDAIGNPDHVLIVSSISIWELRAKVRAERRRGRQELMLDPVGAIRFCAAADILVDLFTAEDATVALAVEPPHGDPFDEMLLVHAQRLGARLLTRDERMVDHPLAYLP